jgi:outer membrane protein assembly factor BamB
MGGGLSMPDLELAGQVNRRSPGIIPGSRQLYHPTGERCFGPVFLVLLCAVGVGLAGTPLPAEEWPQWRGPGRDGVWREAGIVDQFTTSTLKPKWSREIGGGYSGPTVADGRVVVMDRVDQPVEVERILCFDDQSGDELWSQTYECRYQIEYPQGPRSSVSLNEGRAYALGTMGHFHCLDAGNGKILWAKDLMVEYAIRMPVWGISTSPLVESGRVFLQIGGSDGACMIALDTRDGRELWRALDDPASYASPVMIQQGGKPVLVVLTGNHVTGLNPSTGKGLWRYPFKPTRMVINIAAPVVENDHLLVSSFFDGSMLLRLEKDGSGIEKLWHRRGINEKKTDGLHAMIGTPYIEGDYIYGVDSYGQLRCLRTGNGERVWENLSVVPRARWATVHMVRQGKRTWLFNELGELIIAELSPSGYREISRVRLIEPTGQQAQREGGVCWAHPAFADQHIFARSQSELVCTSLAGDGL